MVSQSSPAPHTSRGQVTVIGTLMPHLAPRRHLVLIAMVISVATGWGGPSTRPTPPQPGSGGGLVPHASAAGAIHRSTDRSVETRWGAVGLASTSTSLAAGGATTIDLGDGVTVTLAPGWTVTNRGEGFANLYSNDKNAGAYVAQGPASAPDINGESTANINGAVEGNGITNVQQIQGGAVQAVQGRNFQQTLEVDYTGNVQTNQGTGQVYGAWVTLFNPSTQNAGLFSIYSWTPDGFKAALPDTVSMLASML